MKKKILIFVAVLAPLVAMSSTISLTGSTDFGGGGDFADYNSLNNGDLWGDSSVTQVVAEGDATLSVSRTGINPSTTYTTSVANWSESNYRGAGTEINFQLGAGTLRTADFGAVLGNHFISFQLETDFLSTLDDISVSMWRNGAAAAETYQFAYANDGVYLNDTTANAQTTVANTFLGSAVNNTTDSASNTFSVASSVNSDWGTLHEVRLYFWNGGDVQANTHLFEVNANYSIIPEPSSLALLALGLSLSVVTLRHRRR